MRCITRVAACSIALLVFSAFSIRDAAATQIALNFVPASSTLTWGGFFAGNPFVPQSAPGTTDYNAALPSNTTTHQGTITVDVDNLLTPSSIQILSSNANPDPSGKWLPEPYGFLPSDVDGDTNHYEFPDDASSSVGTNPGAATDADFAIEISPGVDVAYATIRDAVFNITTPAAVPVVAGAFASTTENFELATGWWDYWLHPTFSNPKFRQRLEVAGGDEDNTSAVPSTYVSVPLGGGLHQITLTIPVNVLFPDDTAPTSYTGTLVATAIIPEPTSVVLLALGLVGLFGVRRRG
jgi:PEP-CTERM motif